MNYELIALQLLFDHAYIDPEVDNDNNTPEFTVKTKDEFFEVYRFIPQEGNVLEAIGTFDEIMEKYFSED